MIAALVGEGSSDQALLPILRWVLSTMVESDIRVVWVDTSRLNTGPKLADKLRGALVVQPCDMMFVHRDADRQPPEWRYAEVRGAVAGHPHVAVVPIRMTEAWLLFDEGAIRAAAGRVSASDALGLPALHELESIADPKRLLHDVLRRAHGATGRRARRFAPAAATHRVAGLVIDWSPLRELPAFRRLEADTRETLAGLGVPLVAADG